MSRYRLIAVLLLAAAALVACSSPAEAPAGQQGPIRTEAVATPAATEEAPRPAPTGNSAQAAPTETPIGQEAKASQPATAEPASEPTATATARPQFNGEYEGTFYRGSAAAPITMVDYSDFL